MPCEVSRPVQRHVIHFTQRRKRTVPHVTENEPENTRRSLVAGVYWHLFVQVHYKHTRLSWPPALLCDRAFNRSFVWFIMQTLLMCCCVNVFSWYWSSKSVHPSVFPSVRNVPVSDENGLTYRHSFFHHTVANHSSFTSIKHLHEIPTGGTKYRWGIKISRFSTNESLGLAISRKRYKISP